MKKFILILLAIASVGVVFALDLFGGNGDLTLTVPILDMKGHIGKCVVEVLDQDDNVVGSTYRYVYVNSDAYTVPMSVRIKKKVEDYDLLRIAITFKKAKHVYSLFQLQDKMIVKIIGQNEFIKGTPCTYRVVVKNQGTNEPVSDARVVVTLTYDDEKEVVFTGTTDRSGECTVDFVVTKDIDNADLHFNIDSDIGKDEHEAGISFYSGNMTYLVTDKPIYQPGQMIHIRTLSLQKPDLIALQNKEILFEVEDSKGNKVFKKKITTDKYGTAYIPFLLADEVNFGNYTVRAILINDKIEKTVKVEKYVLPKFKVTLDTDREFYLPGETMEGDIDVQYFFGKPVVQGNVTITTFRYDIGFQQEAVLEGKTDEKGHYHFTYQMPDYFVGEPLEKGDAFMRLDVEVIDKANHSEKISLTKKVVQDVISLSVVPEGGRLRPNLENRLYVLANYPDGSPCIAQVTLETENSSKNAKTDEYGVAEFIFTPENVLEEIKVTAQDEKGEKVELTKQFSLDVDQDQIILRMARGIYTVGDKVDLQFLTTKKTGRVYIDVIKNNQTVLTKSVNISGGKGAYTLALTPDITGSIWLHAYIVTPGGDIVRDTRFCYVHAVDDLMITVKGDQDEYLPGADGKIEFTVTDKNGRPKVAALCVAIVDEAVFAVSELQPGLEKVYFRLEKEILTPRYEIHGFKPVEIVQKPPIDARAENVLFSTLEPKEPFTVNYTTPQEVDAKIQQAFYNRLIEVRDNIYQALNQYYNAHNEYPKTVDGIEKLVDEDFLDEQDLYDPWARRYRITTSGEYLSWFNIASAGPDGVFDNNDDVTEWTWGWEEAEMMFDGVAEQRMMMPKAAAPVAGAADRDIVTKSEVSSGRAVSGEKKGPGEPRVREYFPETFIFEPALITDASGNATLSVTMPDAITTWRVTSFANSAQGKLGSDLSQIRVFQDFFVDIDLPIALTDGDEISIPVAMYNYLSREQKIRVVLQGEDWFDILDKSEITKTLKKDEVSVVYFPIKVKKIGYYSMLIKAYGDVKSDAIKRSIAVLPDGRRFDAIVADRLEGTVTKTITFPVNTISDANAAYLRIYPGIYSQIVQGLDGLFQMPFGCFEQTSSVTYPNILLLDYMRQTEQIKPEIEMAAEEYISIGYQKLLSFEVSGGGFSWFGDAPANKVLTAYGLMEFSDMAKVYEIDERLIDRTAQWLANQQNKDGSWSPDAQYLHAESWTRIQKNELLPTAYIVWAIGETGKQKSAVSQGVAYLKKHWASAKDPYILALIANALVVTEPKGATTLEVLKKLVSIAKEDNDAVYWSSDIPTITFSRDQGADIEATGLATYALIKSGKYSDTVTKALTYITRTKDPSGLWYTTQGTVICLRSLVAALGGSAEDVNADVIVMMNGKTVTELTIDNENADLMHQVELTDYLGTSNKVEITVKGEGNFLYEIASTYYIPWKELPRPEKPPFTIDVKYDRTKLAINDQVNVDVSIKLNAAGTAQMVMIDLGIPPGFVVQTPILDELVGKKIQKYSITPRQLVIYLDEVDYKQPVEFSYSIKAKYPIKAQVRASRVYEYYNTDDEGVEQPIQLNVTL